MDITQQHEANCRMDDLCTHFTAVLFLSVTSHHLLQFVRDEVKYCIYDQPFPFHSVSNVTAADEFDQPISPTVLATPI